MLGAEPRASYGPPAALVQETDEEAALSGFERRLLDALLVGEEPWRVPLRIQAELATVTRREFSGAGFFIELAVPVDAPRPEAVPSRAVDDGAVIIRVPYLEHDAGAVLFVAALRLATIEGYAFAASWPVDDAIAVALDRDSREKCSRGLRP